MDSSLLAKSAPDSRAQEVVLLDIVQDFTACRRCCGWCRSRQKAKNSGMTFTRKNRECDATASGSNKKNLRSLRPCIFRRRNASLDTVTPRPPTSRDAPAHPSPPGYTCPCAGSGDTPCAGSKRWFFCRLRKAGSARFYFRKHNGLIVFRAPVNP